MKEEITWIIENPPKEYYKELMKLNHYTKRHRNTTILILNHNKKNQKKLIIMLEYLKNPKIEYYTPKTPMSKQKALKQLIEKHILTQRVGIIPTKHSRILRHLPTIARKLRKSKAIKVVGEEPTQAWITKELIKISKETPLRPNYWDNIQLYSKISIKQINLRI